jgi:hypothetical protein
MRPPHIARRPKRLTAVAVAMALAGSAAIGSGGAGAANGPRSLCSAGETAIFSCATVSKKQLAVCARLPHEVQYRFGVPGQVELAYPPSARHGPLELRYAEYHRHLVNRYTLSFDSGDFAYSIFDFDEGNLNEAGVIVRRKTDDKEFVTRCLGKAHGNLTVLKQYVACDKDSALNLGSCP